MFNKQLNPEGKIENEILLKKKKSLSGSNVPFPKGLMSGRWPMIWEMRLAAEPRSRRRVRRDPSLRRRRRLLRSRIVADAWRGRSARMGLRGRGPAGTAAGVAHGGRSRQAAADPE